MKFSLSWLRTHLATEAPLDRILTTLSAIGLEVEAVHARDDLAAFRTARILEARRHPDADRLQICRVDAGTGAEIGVVCGAPNARNGLHAVFAPPGTTIPGSGAVLKVGTIRGVQSAGMLVSAREMGLGDEHDGIVELPEGTPVGLSYAGWAGLDDPVVTVGVTPNRGDALAVRGIARDLAAAGLGTLLPWFAPTHDAAFQTPLAWRADWPEACPWILGRSVRGLRNGSSPHWLRRRLQSIGLRPISALVDITNFFTHDLGRPLHVFDADRLAGPTLTLRRGAGETFGALHGRDVTAGPDDLVIADANGPVSLAGVVGGQASGSTPETRHAFIECALFDPVTVALTGRRHQIATDARQRFERGIDPSLPPDALEAATAMILDLCGGEPGTIVSAGAEPFWRREASLRFERIAGLGGADMPADEAVAILDRLGFAATARDPQRVTVSVPPWRPDVAGRASLDQSPALDPPRARTAAEGAALLEPECDLLEEVLRIRGLDAIPALSLPARLLPQGGGLPGPALTPRQTRSGMVRRALAARGLAECVTYSFVASDVAALFGEVPDTLTLRNPIAADLDQMRPTPLATLAPAAARNLARGAGSVALFEVGPGYGAAGQTLVAAGLRGGVPARHWSAAQPESAAFTAKADCWALLRLLDVPLEALSLTRDAPPHYHPGQSAIVRQGPRVLGRFGALHPALLGRLDLPAHAAGFELFLDEVADPRMRRRAPPNLPSLQPVARDFAFLVPADTPAETVLRAARSADRIMIAHVALFDVYEGVNVSSGEKSIGVEVIFQPRESSLTDGEIEALSEKVVQSVAKVTGARLR